MNCDCAIERLSEHLDGVLGPEEERLLTSHLAECALCRQRLDDLRETVTLLRELPEVAPPPNLAAEVRARLASRPRAWTWSILSGPHARVAIAAALVTMLFAYGYLRYLTPTAAVSDDAHPLPPRTHASGGLQKHAVTRREVSLPEQQAAAGSQRPADSMPATATLSEAPVAEAKARKSPAAPKPMEQAKVEARAGGMATEADGRIWRDGAERASAAAAPEVRQAGEAHGGATFQGFSVAPSASPSPAPAQPATVARPARDMAATAPAPSPKARPQAALPVPRRQTSPAGGAGSGMRAAEDKAPVVEATDGFWTRREDAIGLRIRTPDPSDVAQALQELLTVNGQADRLEARGTRAMGAAVATTNRTFEVALPEQDYPALLSRLRSLGEVESLPAKRSTQATSAASKARVTEASQTNLLIRVEVVPR